ncbi:unnamed protein product [Phaeothamnion confervicola]
MRPPLPAGGVPGGPVLCTPEALLPRAHAPAPEAQKAFVTAALRGLAELFPQDANPLYAGFGSDAGQAAVLRRCGVPEGRVFACQGGELRGGANRTFRLVVHRLLSM